MYAAMPAIFKESIEKAYEVCGWDLGNSIYIPNKHSKYPTFRDLVKILPEIINNSSYSSESKGDYIGALVTRVRSMTTGISGQIFCDDNDIDDSVLFDENTIVDLSRVGSMETKSLIMGIIVMKLNEYRMATTAGENISLKHVTVLEEAHNLLKRTSTEQSQEGSNLMGKSVEMISNSIAEMRTYGEGFIIIDQSPTAVDISAIKNTNTKIVMRLPEKGDCEAIGMAMALNEEQVNELSKLGKGKAVILQNDWLEAVLTSIYFWGDKYKTTLEQPGYEQTLKMRGMLVKELYEQYNSKSIDYIRLNDIINNSGISTYKKAEYCTLIKKELENRNNIPAERFAMLLSAILNCDGLFAALPATFKGQFIDNERLSEETIDDAEAWRSIMSRALNKYLIIEDDLNNMIIKFLLYGRAKTFTEDHRYLILYKALYKRGMLTR